MARIIGYTRKKSPKWPYIIISIVFLLSLLIAVLVNAFKENAKPAQIPETTTTRMVTTTTTTLTNVPSAKQESISIFEKFGKKNKKKAEMEVEKMVFSNGIDEYNQPLDSFVEVSKSEVSRVYCYTKIHSAEIPKIVRHVWVAPDGSEVAEIKLRVHNQPAHTWSYINLTGASAGEWRVVVKTEDGSVIGEKKFLLYQ